MKSDTRHTFPEGHKYCKGREEGSSNRTKLALQLKDSIGEANLDQIIKLQVDCALKGDQDAQRYCMDKVYPKPVVSTKVKIDLTVIHTLEDVGLAQNEIIEAVTSDALSLEVGERLMGVIEQRSKVIYNIEQVKLHDMVKEIQERLDKSGNY